MSRVYWDSMLFIYLIEAQPELGPVVLEVARQCADRGDTLCTSQLSVAETLVGMPHGGGHESVFMEVLEDLRFVLVDFNAGAVAPFRRLRRDFGLKQADAINLACASAFGVDLFLTHDTQLLKQHLIVPGIHFIADFTKAPL